MTATIAEKVLETLASGEQIKQYNLVNKRGTVARFLNLGASWVGFQRPEDEESLVLGCDDLDCFKGQIAYLGATVGRYANRIGYGKFKIQDAEHQLTVNLPPHHLHGGKHGLSSKIWASHIVLDDGIPTLTFTCQSPDGEEGFPGNADFKVVIRLLDNDEVRFEYFGEVDQPSIINLTNHAYFNLSP